MNESVLEILKNDLDTELDHVLKKKPQLINWVDQQGMTLLHREGFATGLYEMFIKQCKMTLEKCLALF